MKPINFNDLQQFVGVPLEITIQDSVGGDQAPTIHKTVKKIQLCPDATHIRFYLDDFYFVAVPLASRVSETTTEWSAFDQERGLLYRFKKVDING